MKRFMRWGVALLIVAAIIVGMLSLSQQGTPTTETLETQVLDETLIERGALAVTVSGTGTLLPARQIPLVFELTAPVTEILAQAGDTVREGDVIAKLDAADFEAALRDAELAVRGAQLAYDALTSPARDVDIAVAEAALAAARASYNAAGQTGTSPEAVEIARLQTELARNQLWQSQLQSENSGFSLDLSSIPGVENLPQDVLDQINSTLSSLTAPNRTQTDLTLEQLELSIGVADANFTAAQSRGPDYGSLNSAKAGVIQAQVALDRLVNGPDTIQLERATNDLEQAQLTLEQARAAMDRAQLIAPFDGVIAQSNLTVGQLPPTREPAALLMDLSAYYVELPVDETDITQIAVNQPVRLTLDALPGVELSGVVERVSQTPTVIGELVTYLARVRLDATDAPLRVGMSATAQIITRQVDDVLLVRNNFVRIDRTTQQAFVTVARANGSYEEVPVELGARNESFSEVLRGVNKDDRIVLLPRTESLFGFGGPPQGVAR